MNSVTIPKNLTSKGDLVVIPRGEYETLLNWARFKPREFVPTLTQKKALSRAESNFKKGKMLSYDELVKKMGFGN